MSRTTTRDFDEALWRAAKRAWRDLDRIDIHEDYHRWDDDVLYYSVKVRFPHRSICTHQFQRLINLSVPDELHREVRACHQQISLYIERNRTDATETENPVKAEAEAETQCV